MTAGGQFFAIDARAWRFVCKLGLNAACAYLVLARGTGPDNRTSAWSAHAVENYAAISRSRAQAAIAALEAAGALRRVPGRSASKPLYKVTPAHEIRGCEGHPPAPMTPDQVKVHAALGSGWRQVPARSNNAEFDVWKSWVPRLVAESLAAAGHAERGAAHHFRAIHYDAAAATSPTWIWLPNALIDGVADETPPLQLLRQVGDVTAVRLLVELYDAHTLDENGGVHFRQVRQDFERFELGRRGQYVVWGFRKSTLRAFRTAAFVEAFMAGADNKAGVEKGWTEFWRCFQRIEALGLIEWVAHLIEADTDEAEVIYPVALPGTGLPIERELHNASGVAAGALLTDAQVARGREIGVKVAAPVLRHIENVQVVGVCRLRYRPRTARTTAFISQESEWREILAKLRAIGDTGSATAATSRDIKGAQGEIKTHQGRP